MIQGKKQIFLFLLCVVNIFLVFKIFDDQSGLPVYKDLRLKIERVQEKLMMSICSIGNSVPKSAFSKRMTNMLKD